MHGHARGGTALVLVGASRWLAVIDHRHLWLCTHDPHTKSRTPPAPSCPSTRSMVRLGFWSGFDFWPPEVNFRPKTPAAREFGSTFSMGTDVCTPPPVPLRRRLPASSSRRRTCLHVQVLSAPWQPPPVFSPLHDERNGERYFWQHVRVAEQQHGGVVESVRPTASSATISPTKH
jgi:hypothetical protein